MCSEMTKIGRKSLGANLSRPCQVLPSLGLVGPSGLLVAPLGSLAGPCRVLVATLGSFAGPCRVLVESSAGGVRWGLVCVGGVRGGGEGSLEYVLPNGEQWKKISRCQSGDGGSCPESVIQKGKEWSKTPAE